MLTLRQTGLVLSSHAIQISSLVYRGNTQSHASYVTMYVNLPKDKDCITGKLLEPFIVGSLFLNSMSLDINTSIAW